jgi:acyl-CoA oxidase
VLSAQFCLTEVGHGLDISNLETTAELMDNGDICLNTPSPNAAKSVNAECSESVTHALMIY